jgi:hypothetical protein
VIGPAFAKLKMDENEIKRENRSKACLLFIVGSLL